MTIGLVLHPYDEEHPAGLARSILMWVKTAVEEGTEHDFIIIMKQTPKGALPISTSNYKVHSLKGRSMWRPGTLNHLKDTVDVFVFFTPVMPIGFHAKRIISVVFDLAYMDMPGQSIRSLASRFSTYLIHAYTLQHSDSIVAISEYTKKRVRKWFCINKTRISIIPLSYFPLNCTNETKKFEQYRPYFLFAGVIKERKNVLGLVHGFAEYKKNAASSKEKLLIAGSDRGAYAKHVREESMRLGLGEEVILLGYVDDADMCSLYKDASLFVFPSLLEGFGMPILEAMAVGVPVVTSDHGAMSEVAGGAAELVDVLDPVSIGRGLSRVVGDSNYRKTLAARGKEQVKKFSWTDNANSLLRLCTDLSH